MMMNTRTMRWVVLVLGVVITLHLFLGLMNESYSRATYLSGMHEKWQTYVGAAPNNKPKPVQDDAHAPNPVFKPHTDAPSPYLPKNSTNSKPTSGKRAKAAFIVLSRNSELDGVLNSVRQMEARFNWKFGYPYIFLNEEPFSDEFKQRTTEAAASGKTSYGLIPHDHWFQPSWINETHAAEERKKMKEANVLYGDLISYRNMCRFNSGFFYKHELLKDLEWYWRIEPSVDYYCDIDYDPFIWMEQNKKVYGFNVAIYEFRRTIETLWSTVTAFTEKYPQHVARDNAMGFLSDNGGKEYNLCHFWSNFEIGSLAFYRSQAYQDYFDFLDKTGGFYYERWGDAPIHSIAVSLFLPKDKIHFFNDIGYRHGPYTHCPRGEAYKFGHCYCDPHHNFDYDGYSCMPRWDKLWK